MKNMCMDGSNKEMTFEKAKELAKEKAGSLWSEIDVCTETTLAYIFDISFDETEGSWLPIVVLKETGAVTGDLGYKSAAKGKGDKVINSYVI